MRLENEKLKEILARSDEYFQFKYEEYKTFGARLKKWRELNNISQLEMAEAIYAYRKNLGLEDDDISKEILKENYSDNKPIDYEVEAKRCQKKERRIMSLMQIYRKWESKETDSFFTDTIFSMTHLRILKKILECDYDFLFCEIDTPHKRTKEISDRTSLNISTVEKLYSYDKSYMQDGEQTDSALYAHNIVTALDKMISDDDLMTYISWYLTNLGSSDTNFFDEDPENAYTTITINKPVIGVPTEDAYLDGDAEVLGTNDIHLIYLITIANKLSKLRTTPKKDSFYYPADIPSFNNIVLAEKSDSFGKRLRKLREYNHYTQSKMAELILAYREEHNLKKIVKGISFIPEKNSILRTYQNWESKSSKEKDIRLSMTDLFILKTILKCDYEYLFGEINTIKVPKHNLYHEIGLSPENIEKLETYAKSSQEDVPGVPAYASKILSTIDLIVSDNNLLSNLAYYLSDMPFYTNMNHCSILKPVKTYDLPDPAQNAYSEYLFPDENEMRNIFFPALFTSFMALRERNRYNNMPLIDHTNKEFEQLQKNK